MADIASFDHSSTGVETAFADVVRFSMLDMMR